MIDGRELVEHTKVHGNFYGTPRTPSQGPGTGQRASSSIWTSTGKVNVDKAFPAP